MKRLKVELSSCGVVLNNTVFRVLQGERLIIEDRLSGKITDVFTRQYDVNAGTGELSVHLPAGNIPGLNVKATLS